MFFFLSDRSVRHLLRRSLPALFFSSLTAVIHAQQCAAVPAHNPTPAEAAYINASYAQAEELYAQALAHQPHDAALSAALVRTLLHQGKVAEAAQQATANLADNPSSAAALTAAAEVELREGEPWQALETLDKATAADRCYARAHLIRSRVLRIDSMYASERAAIQSAYEIDPSDPDIQQAWQSVVHPAQEITGIEQSLATMKDLDADLRQKAEATAHSMLPLLSENSETCKVLPTAPSAVLPLQPSKQDGKNIDGYRLEVQLPKGAVKLDLDTASSGVFITRALAEANGFQPSPDSPTRTVHADSIRIGALEFRDCTVGVSDAPFPGKADGAIGTDLFASYLVTIDPREQKLKLDPLPAQAGPLPGDRSTAAEFAGFQPVYHRRQYLLVPVTLDNKTRKLFVLDSGMRLSAMGSDTAHSVSNLKVNFTNPLQTASGPPAQVYRDNFDFQFASLTLPHQNHILEFDPVVIDHNAGFEIGGLLGFDILHNFVLHLDYRDGLVRFDSTNAEIAPTSAKGTMTASAEDPPGAQCPMEDLIDRPINSTIEAKVIGTLDSAHLKPGKEIWVKSISGYQFPGCLLNRDTNIYGHVIATSSTRNPDSAEMALVFDHGDCAEGANKPLLLRLIGLIAPPDESPSLHDALPSQVAGGGRNIQNTVADSNAYDAKLNPGGPPHTVHPGVVIDMPKVKLEPDGGPSCSARITSTSRNVELGVGAELILTMSGKVP